MEKYLGIDYGAKKIGLAIADSQVRVAVPYKILENGAGLFDEVKDICFSENITTVVVGVPLALNQTESKQTRRVKKFIEDLRQALDFCRVVGENEVLSSKQAQKLTDYDKKEDDVAAMIILQSYLDSKV